MRKPGNLNLSLPRQVLPFVLIGIPSLMAIFLVAITEGKSGVRSLLRNLTEWRIGFKWLGIAMAVTITMRLAINLIALIFEMIPSIQFRSGTPLETISAVFGSFSAKGRKTRPRCWE